MLVSDQANYLATYLDHGHSIFAYTYRFDCQTLSFVIFHWPRIGSNADILRSQLCRLNVNIEQLDQNRKSYKMRFVNLLNKNVLLFVILIMTIGIYWKLRQQKRPMRVSGRANVITLKQTVILLILISLDNAGLSYVICRVNSLGMSEELVFRLEMLRVILIENIFFKFLLPLYFLERSRTSLPSLWAQCDSRKLKFFLTTRRMIGKFRVILLFNSNGVVHLLCHHPPTQLIMYLLARSDGDSSIDNLMDASNK